LGQRERTVKLPTITSVSWLCEEYTELNLDSVLRLQPFSKVSVAVLNFVKLLRFEIWRMRK